MDIPNKTELSKCQVNKVGQLSSDGSQAGSVYTGGGLSPTICAGCHGYAIGYIIVEVPNVRQHMLLHRRELLEGNDIRNVSEKA